METENVNVKIVNFLRYYLNYFLLASLMSLTIIVEALSRNSHVTSNVATASFFRNNHK